MGNDSNDQLHPLPPETFTGLDLKPPGESAGGIPSVLSAVKHTFGKMGVARSLVTLNKMNQKGGFDCMSCAWPDPDGERSHLGEFCENGVKAVADEGMTKKITPEFFAQHSVAELSQQSDFWLNQQGRLTQPMVLRKGATHYEPIAWDDAFALLAQELNALDSPHEAVFYTSGRMSNEAAFLYQLFVRMFGTNNLPDCSNMCHESSGTALSETIGIGKGTVTLDDFKHAEAIIVIGQNPGTNHPRMLIALQEAKRNGAKIITIKTEPEKLQQLVPSPLVANSDGLFVIVVAQYLNGVETPTERIAGYNEVVLVVPATYTHPDGRRERGG